MCCQGWSIFIYAAAPTLTGRLSVKFWKLWHCLLLGLQQLGSNEQAAMVVLYSWTDLLRLFLMYGYSALLVT